MVVLKTSWQTSYTAKETAEKYDLGKDYLAGANIAAFEQIADAMIAQGLV